MKIKNKLKVLTILPVTLAVVVACTVFVAGQRIDISKRQERAAWRMVNNVFDLNLLAHEFLYLSQHGERARQQWLLKYERLTSQLTDMIKFTA